MFVLVQLLVVRLYCFTTASIRYVSEHLKQGLCPLRGQLVRRSVVHIARKFGTRRQISTHAFGTAISCEFRYPVLAYSWLHRRTSSRSLDM
ncbi:uncharacterized protein C8R40DRAFT_1137588 [Lentinula edodes]|uniref:uncharacterized protein n=1 Tax=Lentinula edodes TaxID=5353 RepID=UPI001E8D0940|nr:uncharacterized protein C8R40DRAFT_1137588 [Lentinula edodes]KAH7867690.1 hypothetical protein C8R40DRAFT_1137588 [Lentinula edodes]